MSIELCYTVLSLSPIQLPHRSSVSYWFTVATLQIQELSIKVVVLTVVFTAVHMLCYGAVR
jgi:hypothetical protein